MLLVLNTGPEAVEMNFPMPVRGAGQRDVTLTGVDPSARVKVPCYSIVVEVLYLTSETAADWAAPATFS